MLRISMPALTIGQPGSDLAFVGNGKRSFGGGPDAKQAELSEQSALTTGAVWLRGGRSCSRYETSRGPLVLLSTDA